MIIFPNWEGHRWMNLSVNASSPKDGSGFGVSPEDSFDAELEGDEAGLELPPTLLVPFAIVLASLLIAGVLGNILVIAVLIRARIVERSRGLMATATTTNAYILSLSAADLLFLVFCAPFQGTVYILNHWPYGWLMCKVAHYCQYCTVYASIWILTTMSVDRYVAIGHPLKSVKWRHPRQAVRISAVVWLTAALLSFPWLILYEADEHETAEGNIRVACYDAWSDTTYRYRKWMILFVFLIGFLIPSCVIFCMAVLVAKSIRMATHQPIISVNGPSTPNNLHAGNGNELVPPQPAGRQAAKFSIGGGEWGGTAVGVRLQRRRRVGWLVFALAFLFFFCWMPHNLSVIWLNFDSSALDWIQSNHQAFFIIKLLAHMMTYVNSCVNPVLYSLASNNFRGRFLPFVCGGSRPSNPTYNSSCRFDKRSIVQGAPPSIWLRHPSTAGLGTSPMSSTRKMSTISAARKNSSALDACPSRQQQYRLSAWPLQHTLSSSSTVSAWTAPDPPRKMAFCPISPKSTCRKRTVNIPCSTDTAPLEVPLLSSSPPLATLTSTPILGAVHLISERMEVARQAQKRRRSFQQKRMSNHSSTLSDSGIDSEKTKGNVSLARSRSR